MRTVPVLDFPVPRWSFRVEIWRARDARWITVMIGVGLDVATRYAACRAAARVVREV